MRIDKWLWAVRVYKTRSQAMAACRAERVKRSGHALKAGSKIQVGDFLSVNKDGLLRELEVRELLQKRVSAAQAAEALREHTPEERLQAWAEQQRQEREAQALQGRSRGRPSKRDRRQMDKLKEQLGWNHD